MDSTGVPVVDLSKLRSPCPERSAAIHDLGRACQEMGFFQVVNHGISADILHGALDAATAFFNLPMEDKSGLMSGDIRQPVRYSTVSELDDGEVKTRRHLMKQYSRPLETWIDKWPSKPIHYREKMAMFAAEMWRLVSELVEAVTESLGLGRGYLRSQMDRGFEMMALNYYPPWPSQDAGAAAVCCAPHTDYTVLTAVVASSVGLEYMDRESGSWRPATAGSSALLVHVGNYLEVVSNGRYRAALHRVVSHGGARVSVTSLTSFAMEESVEVAEELVEENQPPLYRGSTLSEFLDFLSAGSRGSDFFMEQSLKITPDKF